MRNEEQDRFQMEEEVNVSSGNGGGMAFDRLLMNMLLTAS